MEEQALGEQHAALDGCSPLRLAGLWVYPVKSCAGVPVTAAIVDPHGGLAGDREWAVVNARGEATWQGEFPRLALIRPRLDAEALTLAAPGHAPLRILLDAARPGCELKVWNDAKGAFDVVPAEDAGDAARRWFDAVLGAPLSLVRQVPPRPARAGLNPLHVISTASLDALNDELATPVAIERFRPNLLVAGSGPDGLSAYDELRMDALLEASGDTALQIYAPCARCVVPNVDPLTAEVGIEPLASIARISESRERGSPARFGAYGRAMQGMRFELGMSLWGRFDF